MAMGAALEAEAAAEMVATGGEMPASLLNRAASYHEMGRSMSTHEIMSHRSPSYHDMLGGSSDELRRVASSPDKLHEERPPFGGDVDGFGSSDDFSDFSDDEPTLTDGAWVVHPGGGGTSGLTNAYAADALRRVHIRCGGCPSSSSSHVASHSYASALHLVRRQRPQSRRRRCVARQCHPQAAAAAPPILIPHAASEERRHRRSERAGGGSVEADAAKPPLRRRPSRQDAVGQLPVDESPMPAAAAEEQPAGERPWRGHKAGSRLAGEAEEGTAADDFPTVAVAVSSSGPGPQTEGARAEPGRARAGPSYRRMRYRRLARRWWPGLARCRGCRPSGGLWSVAGRWSTSVGQLSLVPAPLAAITQVGAQTALEEELEGGGRRHAENGADPKASRAGGESKSARRAATAAAAAAAASAADGEAPAGGESRVDGWWKGRAGGAKGRADTSGTAAETLRTTRTAEWRQRTAETATVTRPRRVMAARRARRGRTPTPGVLAEEWATWSAAQLRCQSLLLLLAALGAPSDMRPVDVDLRRAALEASPPPSRQRGRWDRQPRRQRRQPQQTRTRREA